MTIKQVVKERPILFNAAMVRALLDGSKTQTRRIPKHERCPYGESGDRLWVRETWGTSQQWRDFKPSLLPENVDVFFAANYSVPDLDDLKPWRPSIFMPRWASRITLEITDVRVERLQDISAEDATAEGMALDDAVYNYSRLWDKINGDGAFELNPWVWAIEFRVLEGGAE